MNLYSILRGMLLANSSVVALVDDRIFPDWVPQQTPSPYIALERMTSNPIYHFGGESGANEDLFRLSIHGRNTMQNHSVEMAIRSVLSGFSGIVGGVDFLSIFLQNISNLHDSPMDGNDVGLYGAQIDLQAFWKLAPPPVDD